jgi:hypothetical protein
MAESCSVENGFGKVAASCPEPSNGTDAVGRDTPGMPTVVTPPAGTINIEEFDAVCKDEEKKVRITVKDVDNAKADLEIMKTEGEGEATFADESKMMKDVDIPTEGKEVVIKGKKHSSATDNLKLIVRLKGSNQKDEEPFSVVAIQKVEWFDMDGNLLMDENTHPSGTIGVRIFPDADRPSGVPQDKVTVRATITPAIEDIEVHFRSIDVDDPSTSAPIVDDENLKKVNRGLPDQDGKFTRTNKNVDSDMTEGNGRAEVQFQVSMSAGDNFRVIATCLPKSMIEGENVKAKQGDAMASVQDAGGKDIPIHTAGRSPEPAGMMASDLLTVWRKLHIEVDSMGAIPPQPDPPALPNPNANVIKGAVISIKENPNRVIVDRDLDDGSATLPDDRGRFETGTIRIGRGREREMRPTEDLLGNGSESDGRDFVQTREGFGFFIEFTIKKPNNEVVASGVVLSLNGKVFEVLVSIGEGDLRRAGRGDDFIVNGAVMKIQSVAAQANRVVVEQVNLPYELVDDDMTPQLTPRAVMPHDLNTSANIRALEEKYADGYILPVIDGGGMGMESNNKQTIPFKLNITATETDDVEKEFDPTLVPGTFESRNNRDISYWVAYVLAAYQSHPDPKKDPLERGDGDPDSEIAKTGISASGSIIFLEEVRDEDRQFGSHREANLVVHEIGHQFQLPDRGKGGGLMSIDLLDPAARFIPDDINNLRCRFLSPGVFEIPSPCNFGQRR